MPSWLYHRSIPTLSLADISSWHLSLILIKRPRHRPRFVHWKILSGVQGQRVGRVEGRSSKSPHLSPSLIAIDGRFCFAHGATTQPLPPQCHMEVEVEISN